MSQNVPRPILSFRIGDQPVPGYRLVRKLGKGSFGDVWLAVTDNGFERALKIVDLEKRGGKKEFRALRLIKDRKILHGNLLLLVDYWLLDREGTILNTVDDPSLESKLAQTQFPGPGGPSTKLKTDAGAQVQVTPVVGLHNGTMSPADGEDSGPMSVRDTFQLRGMTDTREEQRNHAVWLVVAMELGHKSLNDRQKEFTAEQKTKRAGGRLRKGPTQLDNKGDTSPGSNTVNDGGSRHQEIDDEEDLLPLSAEEVLPYMEQAARGLDHLHRNDIVHRDVKPQNIMLVGDVAKVCDYGLASELGDLRETSNAFTLPYAAPEAINKKPAFASDQYSLAVTYFELRTGRWPFPNSTQTSVAAAKETGVHDLHSIRKRAVRLVLKKALSKNPRDRYENCGDFVKELTKAEQSGTNLFAIAQATLAILAIVTVLMAAAATHPVVWAKIQQVLGPVIPPPPPPPPPSPEEFLKVYKERLSKGMDLLVKEEFQSAALEFEYTEMYYSSLPKADFPTRLQATLGKGRLIAGMANGVFSAQDRTSIQSLLDRRTVDELHAMTPAQRAIAEYLKVVSDPDPISKRKDLQYDPAKAPAKDTLAAWELKNWQAKLPAKSQLLPEIARLRLAGTPTDLETARAKYAELLQSPYYNELNPAEHDFHEITLEGLHLAHHHPSLKAEQNLAEINAYIEKVRGLHERLLARAQLLKLLIIKKHQGGKISIFDDEVVKLVANSERNIYTQANAEGDFSEEEAKVFHDLQMQFEEEIEVRDEPLVDGKPELAYQAVKNWFSQTECIRIFCERLERRLDIKPLEKSHLPAIAVAWNDLRQLVADELGMQVPSTIADLGIRTALISPDADPTKSLAGFTDLFRRSPEEKQFDSFKLLFERAADARWTATAIKPLRELVDDPPLGLVGKLDDPNPALNWKKKLLALEYGNIIAIDPADALVLKAELEKLKTGALAELLRIELQWAESMNAGLSEAQLKEWQKQAEIISSSLSATPGEQADYARFVLACLQAAANYDMPSASKDFAKLLDGGVAPRWLTKTRRVWAEGPLMVLATKELRLDGSGRQLDDDQVYRFFQLSAMKSPELTKLRADALQLGLNPACLNAVEAIRLAIQTDQAGWATVQGKIAARDKKYDKYLEKKRASRLLAYVDCLAQLHTTPKETPISHELIKQVDNLLHKSGAGEAPYFKFDAGPSEPGETVRTDEGLLQNFVDPVLKSLATHPRSKSEAPDMKPALARLYAAKGRLLQRNPHMAVAEVEDVKSKDMVTLTSTLASRAFWEAHQLDPQQMEYVAGYGRALINSLPEDKEEKLAELLEKFASRAKESSGLQYLVARRDRLTSYSQMDRELWLSAVKQFESLRDKLISTTDPWQLLELCYEDLSDAHLRMAFWTKHVTVEEIKALEANREPAAGTKAYHLYHAAQYSKKQLEIENRLLPEIAHISLANAYEDYAKYVGIASYYELSLDQFGQAIQTARKYNRQTANAQFNFGRCMFRYSDDPFFKIGKDEEALKHQVALHKQAIDHLKEASTGDALPPRRVAEALGWLAQNEMARFRLRGRDPDLKSDSAASVELVKTAIRHAGEGAALAQKAGDMPVQFMLLDVQFCALLELANCRTEFGVSAQYINGQLRGVEDLAFQSMMDAMTPTAVSPSVVGLFAKYSGRRYFDSPQPVETEYPLRDRWLPEDGKLASIWSSTPDWRFEEFLVRLHRVKELDDQVAAAERKVSAATTTATRTAAQAALSAVTARQNGELKKAEDLLSHFSPAVKTRAESHLADRLARISSEKIRVFTGTGEQLENALRANLVVFVNAKRARDRVIALDSETAAILARINATSFDRLEGLDDALHPAEKRRLLSVWGQVDVATVNVTAGRVALICFEKFDAFNSNQELTRLGFTKRALADLAHDMLKPYYSPPAKAALNNGSLNVIPAGLLPNLKAVERYLITQGRNF